MIPKIEGEGGTRLSRSNGALVGGLRGAHICRPAALRDKARQFRFRFGAHAVGICGYAVPVVHTENG